MKKIIEELDLIRKTNSYRKTITVLPVSAKELSLNSKIFLNFSSNNYLGLSFHPAVKKAASDAVEKYGCGGTSSRLLGGTFEIHEELEQKTAAFKKKEKTLVFPSGFTANLAVISSLASQGDCIIMDKLNHASLWDGTKLSKARIFVYDHLDMNSLEKVLKRARSYRNKLAVTESLFSMDGDIAPLGDFAFLCKKYGAFSMIDEAHATGVFGRKGAGLAEHFSVEEKIDIIMGTYSKALGSQGGFICGDKPLIEFLVNKSRPFIYTTSLAPACAGAALAAIEIIENEPDKRIILLETAQYLRKKLSTHEFDVSDSQSQIVPLITGESDKALKLSAVLFESGILAPAIRPPTVEEGKSRLRFSLTSSHTKADIDKLVKAVSYE